MTGHTILFVGDCKTGIHLRKRLERRGYSVARADTSRVASSRALAGEFDLVVLTSTLPGDEVVAIGRKFRSDPLLKSTPILALSGTDDEEVLREGLKAGIDLYLPHPVSSPLLVAYIRGLFRLYERARERRDVVAAPGLRIDRSRYVVVAYEGEKAKRLDLPHRQFELLHFLASRPGEVFTREELLQRIWENPNVKIRTVDVHIQKIRTQIGERYIDTVNGVGYKFMEFAACDVVEAP